MKAILCKEYGPPESLVYEEAPDPSPGKGEVLIGVHAAGVNFPDTLIIQGKYQFKPDMPFSPGGEVAGEVLEIGEGVSHVKPGDRVMALMTWGGYAEKAVVPAFGVIPMPPDMSWNEGAGFPLVYGTVIHALKQRGRLREGETLLVLGAAGGVGLATVQIGKLMGARVIAAASTAEKLELCREHGADEVVNYSEESLKDRVKELTDGKGADVIFDPVGGDAFDQCLSCINWDGRLLVIGFASGRIPEAAANRILLKGCAVVGVFWGRFAQVEPQENMANFMQLIQWYNQGGFKPVVSRTYPLERAADALNDMLARKATGKLVLEVG
ncbi:oxidoreductase, zinc-binding dehydrogenase family protein [Salinisphaera sp. PC39]|uniref:NADPH:quinone oxidoreductase family protein n=1 Tax=Salinisphaera sp. PC39 TaxID=1304156 RepID=UPI003340AEFD